MPTQYIARSAQFNQNVVVAWSNGANFTGFLLVGLVLPTGYTQAFYQTAYPFVAVPTFLKVPINNGSFHPAEGITYNADLEPPNTQYVCWYYDSTGQQIAGPSPLFTVATATCTPPSLTLTAPSAGAIPPVPNSGPTVTTNMNNITSAGYYVVDYAPTLNLDLANAFSQECVATGPVTLSTPIYTGSTIVPGFFLTYKHTQDTIGGRTLDFGAIFVGMADQNPDLTPDTYSQYVFQYTTSSKWQIIGSLRGIPIT